MPEETLFAELKRFVRFDDRDAALLAKFHTYASPEFPRIVQAFYDRIREHERAHAVLTGEPQIVRLQRSLLGWLHRVCLGPHDEKYFEETSKIGRMHVKVGLPQEYIFSAMALIRVAFENLADQHGGADARATREAIARMLDLELAIIMRAYRDDYVERLQHVERRERAALEGALASAQHRYANAVELARVCILGLDSQGQILLFNREAEHVTGYARDEVIGKPLVDTLVLEEMREPFAAALRATIAQRVAGQPIETVISTRTGSTREMRCSLAYAGDAGDEVVVFLLGHDITDEKADAKRRLLSDKLAAVGTLAAGLAHEIRNPLNGAKLHLSFLERSLKAGGDVEALQAVNVVADEIKRLANLVTEFLEFAGPKPLVRQPVSIRNLCDRVVQVTASQAQSVGVSVAVDHPGEDIVLDADGAKLEQVLLNLVQNAIEALAPSADAPKAGRLDRRQSGHVVLRARRQPRRVQLEVEDDGPGLPSPEAPIFDAFYSSKPSGTGLGLAIAHRIVTDHGGSIAVDSRPRRTIFRVLLPLSASG
jgi:PAS domain S-box-containing protein